MTPDAASLQPSASARPAGRRPGRSLAATAGLLAAALLVTGCSLTSRNLTLEAYAPSDGLDVDLGDLLVRNVLVVSAGNGAEGMVSATMVNRSPSELRVLLEAAESSQVLTLEPGESVQLGSGEEQVAFVVDSVEVPAGGLLEVTVTSDAAGAETLQAPVYSPVAEFATITPPPTSG